jgi:hypothetical protein
MTVAEHLNYITSIQNTFETQFIMVQRLKEHINNELDRLTKEAIQAAHGICQKFGYSFEEFRLASIDRDKRYITSRKIEDLFISLKPLFSAKYDVLKASPYSRQIESLYTLIDSYRKDPDLLTTIRSDNPITDQINRPEISLYPKDQFHRELAKISKLVDGLINVFSEDYQILSYLENFALYFADFHEEETEELNYNVLHELISIIKEYEDKTLYDTYYDPLYTYDQHVSTLREFLKELDHKTHYLESLASIYVDNVLDSMRINWTGTQGDAKYLFDFLLKEKYITAETSIDPFLANHFLFKGKSKTKERVNSFPESTDRISRADDYSLIIKLKT